MVRDKGPAEHVEEDRKWGASSIEEEHEIGTADIINNQGNGHEEDENTDDKGDIALLEFGHLCPKDEHRGERGDEVVEEAIDGRESDNAVHGVDISSEICSHEAHHDAPYGNEIETPFLEPALGDGRHQYESSEGGCTDGLGAKRFT